MNVFGLVLNSDVMTNEVFFEEKNIMMNESNSATDALFLHCFASSLNNKHSCSGAREKQNLIASFWEVIR